MMDNRRKGDKVIVASDSRGNIIAAAHSVEGGEIATSLEALEGQTLHELEIPAELAALESSDAILAALADARITPGGTLKLREIRHET